MQPPSTQSGGEKRAAILFPSHRIPHNMALDKPKHVKLQNARNNRKTMHLISIVSSQG
jgi:hypothetical protein